MAVNAVIRHNLVPNKSALAESLGVKQAKFSEILNGRMKAGTDMLAIMCDFYKVSAEWLLMSRGNNIFRENPNLPKYWVDDDDLTSIYPSESSMPQKTSSLSGDDPFLALIREKDDIIRSQAEEIGRLKERVEQLEREKTTMYSLLRLSQRSWKSHRQIKIRMGEYRDMSKLKPNGYQTALRPYPGSPFFTPVTPLNRPFFEPKCLINAILIMCKPKRVWFFFISKRGFGL